MSALRLHSGGKIIMGKHIIDTLTMHSEICYVYTCSLAIVTLLQAAADCAAAAAVCGGENLRINMHTYIDRLGQNCSQYSAAV